MSAAGMHIQQMQVAADPLQDRLLLRISTPGGEEFRLQITRRFLRELWPHLTAMLFGHLGAASPQAINPEPGKTKIDPATAAGPIPATPQPNAPASRFDQPFRNDNPLFPLGSQPLLPAEAVIEPSGVGSCKLTLREPRERGFTLSLNADLLQGLCSMLRAGSEQSGWDLPLPFNPPAAASAPPVATPTPPNKTRLH